MEILYKYSGPLGINRVLVDGTLCFSSTSQLNDPFELGLDMSLSVENQIQTLRASIEANWASQGRPGTAAQFVNGQLGEWDRLGFTREMIVALMKRYAWQTVIAGSRRVGVLSLSESASELLMWAHYTQSYKGLVFGFDTGDPLIQEATFGGVCGPQKVIYTGVRARLDGSSYEDRIRTLVLTKAAEWSYEKEVRCLLAIDEGEDRVIRHFSPLSLVRVIFGAWMTKEDVFRCIDICSQRYPAAELLMATPDSSRFAVDLTRLPPKQILQLYWGAIDPAGIISFPASPPN